MHIDDILTYSRAIKPIEGEFSQKPTSYNTARQWLNNGYKVKDVALVRGGKYFAMKNENKGFKYYSKDEVEPMTNEERRYYELKYNKKDWSPSKDSCNKIPPISKVMGSSTNAKSLQKVESHLAGNKNAPVGKIPYNPKMLSNKIMLFINVETTGKEGKGSPKYGDEVVAVSILKGNLLAKDAKMIYNKNIRPIYHSSWKIAEKFNGVSPSDVKDAPTFEEEKRHIQSVIDLGEIIASYGDENFKILEESGIYIPQSSRFDVKEMFAKHHPEIGDFSFSSFIKTYANEEIAIRWKSDKNEGGKKLSEYKIVMNYLGSVRQCQVIEQELIKNPYLRAKSVDKKEESFDYYER